MLADAVCSDHQQRWCPGSKANCAQGETGGAIASTVDACAPATTTTAAAAATTTTTTTTAPAATA